MTEALDDDGRFVRHQLDPARILSVIETLLSPSEPVAPDPPAALAHAFAGPSGDAEPDAARPDPDSNEPIEP